MSRYVLLTVILAILHDCSSFFVASPRALRNSVLNAEAEKEGKEVIGKIKLIDILSDKTQMTKSNIDIVLSALTDCIKEEVLEGAKEIRLRDFGIFMKLRNIFKLTVRYLCLCVMCFFIGTFKQKVSAPRIGRNPQTGAELQISGSTSVAFSVASSLKIKDDVIKKKPASAKLNKKSTK